MENLLFVFSLVSVSVTQKARNTPETLNFPGEYKLNHHKETGVHQKDKTSQQIWCIKRREK